MASIKIAVFGLGHVGTVTAASFLRDGHSVIGLDTQDAVRDGVGRGITPIREPRTAGYIAAGHAAGRLTVATDPAAVADADMAFVCVGTRGLADGTLDLTDVVTVARQLGDAARRRSAPSPLLMVFRSTMPPGSMRGTVVPAVAATAGEAPGARYEIVYLPAFTRVGSAMDDDSTPTRLIIGERRPGSARALLRHYGDIDAPVFTTSFEAAELSKMTDNAFHALKVVFANEIGRYALQVGVSPDEVFEHVRADTKLNLSAAYLRPGGAFGGPCLPKDVRALARAMDEAEIATPVIERILGSNDSHIEFLVVEIARRAAPSARLLLLGLSFKTDSDDVRGSPLVAIAERLLERGYALSIHDPDLGDEVPARAQLPPRIAAALLPQLPAKAAWDLVVVGKETPELLRQLGPQRALFHINRL